MTKLKLVGIEENLKKALDNIKLYKRETYNDIISRLYEEYRKCNFRK